MCRLFYAFMTYPYTISKVSNAPGFDKSCTARTRIWYLTWRPNLGLDQLKLRLEELTNHYPEKKRAKRAFLLQHCGLVDWAAHMRPYCVPTQ